MKYDANVIGTKFKFFERGDWEKIFYIIQGKEFAQKYHFYFTAYLVEDFNLFQIDYYLRFHLKENFNLDFDDFAEFLKLCIRQHRLTLFKGDYRKEKVELIEEWIAKGNPIEAKRMEREPIICKQNASGLLTLFRDLSEKSSPESKKPIVEIENGTIPDFIYSNFRFPRKNSTPLTENYTIRWNESRGSLIALFSYLNKNDYFAPAQKNKIIDFLRREFGSDGLSEDNVKSYWSRINPHEKPLKKLVDALGIFLTYYTSR